MLTLIPLAALLVSVALMQLASGGLGPLDALSGLELGFTPAQIGLLGSAHFLGFFLGCWWAPRLIGRVGHIRAFAVFAAAGTIGLIAHMMFLDPLVWAGLRVAAGLSIAGAYTVIEAWLQARAENANRGRVMGGYRIADLSAQFGAQLLISVLPPAAFISYNVLALLCVAALLPLALTRLDQPETPAAPRLRPALAWRMSPLAVTAVWVAALTAASFRMVGPLYGEEVGLETAQIAWFLAAWVLGGALAQWPVGWLADRFDRRWVLIWLSLASVAASATTVTLGANGTQALLASAALFGIATFPVYSVAAAHAHDFADSEQRVELSAALMFHFALGAIAAPLSAALLIDAFGPWALFALIALGHAVLAVFGVIRMRARATRETRTRYVYTPRTTFTVGRLYGRRREPEKD